MHITILQNPNCKEVSMRYSFLSIAALLLIFLSMSLTSSCSNAPGSIATGNATPAEAERFIKDAEQRLFDLSVKYSRADWVKSTFITPDTEALSAEANEALIATTTELA